MVGGEPRQDSMMARPERGRARARRAGECLGALALVAALVGCGAAKPEAYSTARLAAARADASGEPLAAAAEWARAAEQAGSARDRDEASYRRALSLSRAGRVDDALAALEKLQAETASVDVAGRAAHDRAKLEFKARDEAAGVALLEEALAKHPDSGGAKTTFLLLAAHRRASAAEPDFLAWLAAVARSAGLTDVGELARYELARSYERAGSAQEALREYVALADAFPYPAGGYWDEALFAAARIERQQGHHEAAIALLRRMLAERESAFLQGSYERPLYARARLEIADIERSHGDLDAADAELAALWDGHPTSLVRDDARWQQALLARERGDEARACALLAGLVAELPQSRYVRCTELLCTTLRPPPDAKPCTGSIARAVAERLKAPAR